MRTKRLARVLKATLSVLPLAGAAHATAPVAIEMSAWDAATVTDTTSSYSKFIVENPESPFVEEARSRIVALSGDDETVYWNDVSSLINELDIVNGDRRELDSGFGSFIDV